MADTDAKRGKINELLEYIESRLTELEEEKEELKDFQEKDKERRCMEYALYQRELEEVGEALEEIEEDRRTDVHGANVRRQKYNEREKEIQVSQPRTYEPFIVLRVYLGLGKRDYGSKTLPRGCCPNPTGHTS